MKTNPATSGLRPASFALIALFLVGTAEADEAVRQDGKDPDDVEFRAEAPDRPHDMPLAELPEPPSDEYPAPRPEAVEAMERLLEQITGADELARERASRMLLEAKSDWVSAIARRIEALRESSEPKLQKALLAQMRQQRTEVEDDDDSGKSPDYLQVALAHADPGSSTWRDLTRLLALSRMLSAIGTMDATREIIRIYQRFGEYMRIDCQRQLEAMGDLATAGLIEAQRNQATNVAEWAKRLLRLSGKAQVQTAVRTPNDRALADILVALGRNRDPDSAPILISFASTERAQIRRAARQGLALMGEVSAWQLKDAYLNTTGKHPPRDWTWKRTARELFTEFDRLRLAQAYALYEAAEKARVSGDLQEMKTGYDQVLALNPDFDKKTAMAEGYLRYADAVRLTDRPAALLSLRRAERIAPDEKLSNESKGKRQLLLAEALREKGIIDRALIERSARLNPEERSRSQELLTSSTRTPTWGKSSRYLIAGVTSLLALIGAAWILFTGYRRRGHKSEAPERRQPQTQTKAPDDSTKNEKSHVDPAATESPGENENSTDPPGENEKGAT